jgi:low temperature requirement protein LtrA
MPDPEREPVRGDEHEVTPLELFFDLVFVFAITQVTKLLTTEPTWGGLLRGTLVLAAVWWAWTTYAWLTSAIARLAGFCMSVRPRCDLRQRRRLVERRVVAP